MNVSQHIGISNQNQHINLLGKYLNRCFCVYVFLFFENGTRHDFFHVYHLISANVWKIAQVWLELLNFVFGCLFFFFCFMISTSGMRIFRKIKQVGWIDVEVFYTLRYYICFCGHGTRLCQLWISRFAERKKKCLPHYISSTYLAFYIVMDTWWRKRKLCWLSHQYACFASTLSF